MNYFFLFLHLEVMFLLDAIRIKLVVQSQYWKERILSWTALIRTEWTPLPSAPSLQLGGATTCLQFRMVASVLPVLLRQWPSTSTENLQLVGMTAKEELGPIKFMWWKVQHLNHSFFFNRHNPKAKNYDSYSIWLFARFRCLSPHFEQNDLKN